MNPIDDANTLEPGEPNEPLHDEGLRKALAQAPDRSQIPDWRVRQAILDQAHDAISASEELLAASREGAPWWRLAWWRDKVGLSGATPWNAAFATVVVGVLVTLMWQREPVPGARLDERPAVKQETAREEAERVAPAPASPPADAPKSAGPPASAAPPVRAPVPSAVPAAPEAPAAPSATLPAAPAPGAAAPAAGPPPVPAAAPPVRAPETASIIPPVGESAGPASSQRFAQGNVTAPKPSAADAAAERRKSEPAVAAAPPPPATQPEAKRGARQEPAAAAPAPRADVPPPMPDFASLSRWTELRVANVNGDVRMVPRAEAGELGLLMSSAAIMATGAPPMRTLPEWRVSLERKGQVLAVLEVARTQVRWTEGHLPATTGIPPIESLDALRAALRETARAGSPARVEPVVPPVRAPRAARPEAPAPAAGPAPVQE